MSISGGNRREPCAYSLTILIPISDNAPCSFRACVGLALAVDGLATGTLNLVVGRRHNLALNRFAGTEVAVRRLASDCECLV